MSPNINRHGVSFRPRLGMSLTVGKRSELSWVIQEDSMNDLIGFYSRRSVLCRRSDGTDLLVDGLVSGEKTSREMSSFPSLSIGSPGVKYMSRIT
ncbi:hypothetical protein TNCV_3145871 [Trichonephila clavipes]|nr:hypothetical protein TNCV_3145871 [Trichonephila clavipes]